jgi:putative N6-adenine-specific DNA methylase
LRLRQKVILRKASSTLPIHCSDLVITCAGGLEEAVAEELAALGYGVTGRDAGVVRCVATLKDASRLNRELRTASRVLVPVRQFRVPDFDALYRCAKEIPWDRIIPVSTTFAVTAITRSRKMSDHRFLAMKMKDAVADRQRSGSGGKRSSIDRENPHFRINVFVGEAGDTEISLDASGTPLHQRGYRTEAGDAPLRETVAAAMLREAGVVGGAEAPGLLIDPFCGSGTIAIEAALIATGRPPHGPEEKFAINRWPWYREPAVATAPPKAHPDAHPDAQPDAQPDAPSNVPAATAVSPMRIVAADSDPEMVSIARRNARRAGVEEMIEFQTADVRETLGNRVSSGEAGRVMVVTNPPYGERLTPPDLKRLYTDLGALLKQGIPGGTAWVLCPDQALMRLTGLRASRRIPLYNGGLSCRLYQLEVRK